MQLYVFIVRSIGGMAKVVVFVFLFVERLASFLIGLRRRSRVIADLDLYLTIGQLSIIKALSLKNDLSRGFV